MYGSSNYSARNAAGIAWFEEVIVYLDAVIVLGIDFDDALLALRKAFTCFREHGLKLKEEVEFLRKLVSGSGVSILADKLEAVKQLPGPTNVKELKSFLGFINYHRNYIRNFAQVLADLYL